MQWPWQKKGKRRIVRKKKRTEPHQLKRQIGVGVVLVLLFAALGTGVWYGSRVAALTIDAVAVVGGQTIAPAEITEIIDVGLEGAYYKLVPRRFTWTYPRAQLAAAIAAKERVRNVAVERKGTELTVIFEEYVPQALWCSSLAEESNCAFLDSVGYAFTLAPELTGAAMVRYVNEEPVATNTQAFPVELIERTQEFVAAATAWDLNVVTVETPAPVEISYYIADGGEIRTSLDYTLEETLSNLATILESEEFAHLAPGNFQYIDLRFGKKVFVNEETVTDSIATTTASSTL